MNPGTAETPNAAKRQTKPTHAIDRADDAGRRRLAGVGGTRSHEEDAEPDHPADHECEPVLVGKNTNGRDHGVARDDRRASDPRRQHAALRGDEPVGVPAPCARRRCWRRAPDRARRLRRPAPATGRDAAVRSVRTTSAPRPSATNMTSMSLRITAAMPASRPAITIRRMPPSKAKATASRASANAGRAPRSRRRRRAPATASRRTTARASHRRLTPISRCDALRTPRARRSAPRAAPPRVPRRLAREGGRQRPAAGCSPPPNCPHTAWRTGSGGGCPSGSTDAPSSRGRGPSGPLGHVLHRRDPSAAIRERRGARVAEPRHRERDDADHEQRQQEATPMRGARSAPLPRRADPRARR